ncbi:hypothetical protein BGZ73_008616 [Actinomortierella ambigua]|nr:hypothetical protein BGZ73_008616 [Actinomortierella ambigua]
MSHSPHDSISPPNQPRRSLSTNLQPDYHDWVTNAAAPTYPPLSTATLPGQHSEPASARQSLYPTHAGASSYSGSTTFSPSLPQPPSTTSTSHSLLDAVAQRILPPSSASSSQRRRPRPNQPSFAGSVSTDGANDDGDPDPRADLVHASLHGDEDSGLPRLPSLSESQVPVLDPSRPAYKLGRPNNRLRKSTENEPPATPPSRRRDPQQQQPHLHQDEFTESSALLGNGSRRKVPTYTQLQEDQRSHHDTEDEDEEGDDDFDDRSVTVDLLRRPSRARSMSPTLELRRAGMGRGRNGLAFRENGRQNRGRHSPTNRSHGNGTGDKRSLAFHKLRRSSLANIKDLKTKLLSRRKTVYDDAKEALVRENNGIRVWYHNYTTIDWIHDFVKERVRLRQIRAYPGIRGRIINWADSLKGWVLVLLTGVITACLAAFIDVFSWWLGDLRMGYCKTNFWWSQYFCCWQDTLICDSVCGDGHIEWYRIDPSVTWSE